MPSGVSRTSDLRLDGFFQRLLWTQCKVAQDLSRAALTCLKGKQISSTLGKPCPLNTLCLDTLHQGIRDVGCVKSDTFVKKVHNGGGDTTYAFPPSSGTFTYSCYKTTGTSTDFQDSHSGSTLAIVVDNIEKFGSDVHYITWQGRSSNVMCKVSGAPHVSLWSARH